MWRGAATAQLAAAAERQSGGKVPQGLRAARPDAPADGREAAWASPAQQQFPGLSRSITIDNLQISFFFPPRRISKSVAQKRMALIVHWPSSRSVTPVQAGILRKARSIDFRWNILRVKV